MNAPLACQKCGHMLVQTFICRECFPADSTPGSYDGSKEAAWSDLYRAGRAVAFGFLVGGMIGLSVVGGATYYVAQVHHALQIAAGAP